MINQKIETMYNIRYLGWESIILSEVKNLMILVV